MSVSGVPLKLPGVLTERIERAVNAQLAGAGLRLGSVDFQVDEAGLPRFRLRNVVVTDEAGNGIAHLNELGAGLSFPALLSGRLEPAVVRLAGAQITIRRSADGAFSLAFGGAGQIAEGAGIGDVLDTIDAFFARRSIAATRRVEARDLTITLEDARSGRIWQATGGTLTILNEDDAIAITVVSEVFNGTEELAEVELSFRSEKGSPAATLGVQFENAAAADIALQSPVLSVLGILDAPISGSMRVSVGPDSALSALAATLEIGKGRLRPAADARPVAFESARAYVTYDPERNRLRIAELSAESELVQLAGAGQLYLGTPEGGWPAQLVGQLALDRLEIAPGDLFDASVTIDDGSADFRISLDPFVVDIGDTVLRSAHGRQRLSGRIAAAEDGWTVALDLASDRLTPAAALALWPERFAPGARNWVSENVSGGTVNDFALSLRFAPGARPTAAFSYTFDRAEVKVMRHMPPIREASGRASLQQSRFALTLNDGVMSPGEGPPADLAGSSFIVPDTRIRFAPAEVRLAAAAPLPSLLRLLDNRPFRVLERSPRPEDLLATEGDARLSANVRLSLKRNIAAEDVDFYAAGTLSGVSSERLVPGRPLGAEELRVVVTPEDIEIAGPMTVGGLDVDGSWRQPLAPDAGRGGAVEARLDLTQENLARLGVTLPPGTVSGAAEGKLTLSLEPDEAAVFRLTSDLSGARLSVPPLRWSKAAGTEGTLVAEGRIAQGGALVERLELSAPGLSATGRIEPGGGAGRAVAIFDRVRAGTWLDAPVTVAGRGVGRPPRVSLLGGRVNLSALPPGGSARAGGTTPLDLQLDALRVTEGIDLAPFRGELLAGQGLSGSFDARVNGQTPVRGTLVPAAGGTAIRVTAEDGGAVLGSAGIFPNARGGAFELILVPTGQAGVFDGQLDIERTRLRNAPGLASLLDAVSIIGLLDELQGPGILFEKVDARFRLSPERVVVQEGAAVGASLGLSMDGVYDVATKRMDMQGVISPIYILNGIGQIFTRRGEGLFGFAYRMTGAQGETRVEVNPLSILTPGMFREIFRRPPPTGASQGG